MNKHNAELRRADPSKSRGNSVLGSYFPISMKFTDGLMIHSGDPMNDYVDMAVRHVLLRQGNINLCLSSKPLANDGNYTQ